MRYALLVVAACTSTDASVDPGPSITTIAGENGASAAFSDGIGNAARFASPEGLVVDATGTFLYVADSENHAIRRIELASGDVTTVAGVGGDPDDDDTHLFSPRNLAFDPAGTGLYITDTGNYVIRHLDLATGALTTPYGTVGMPGMTDGVGAEARFGMRGPFSPWPGGLVVDPAGVMYVADSANQTIRAIDLTSHAVTTIAGVAGIAGSANGTHDAATFHKPTGLALGSGTTLIIAEANNLDVRRLDLATRQVDTIAGKAPDDPRLFCENISPRLPEECGDIDAPVGTDARFRFPLGVTPDAGGGLFVVDSHSNVIRHLDLETTEVTTVAGVASELLDDIPHASTDSTPTAPGTFWHPTHVAFAAPSTLYVSDRAANCIRRVELEP